MKRIAACLAALAALTASAGCAPVLRSREVEQLQLIQTLGCDADGGSVTVSVSTGQTLSGEETARLAARGASLTDAIRALQGWSSREELFFAHVRFAVLGEEAAREGVWGLLDYFERSTQTPLDLPLLVVRGGTARALVTGSDDPDYEITALLASLRRDSEQLGMAHCFTVLDTAQRLARSGAALCCAVRGVPAGENVPSAGEGALAVLEDGYAVLRGGALAGYLDADAALGANLLLGLSGRARYVLSDGEGGSVTVELRGAECAVTPLFDDGGALTFSLRVEARAGILESDRCDLTDADAVARLERALAAAIEGQVNAAMERERALRADFLELYHLTGRKMPGRFPGTVTESFLARLRWRTETRAVLERSYDIEAGEGAGGAHA